MKSKNFLWAYIFSLAAGILLICFCGSPNLFRSIVIALGILFLVPSAVAFIMSCVPQKSIDGLRHVKWYLVFTTALGVAFGILLLCIPDFFVDWIVYTLAGILIFCGIAGIVFMIASGGMPGVEIWFYAIPVLTLTCGIIIILVGPQVTEHIVSLIAGIFLVCYSVNGFWGFFHRLRSQHKAQKNLDTLQKEASVPQADKNDDLTSFN